LQTPHLRLGFQKNSLDQIFLVVEKSALQDAGTVGPEPNALFVGGLADVFQDPASFTRHDEVSTPIDFSGFY